MTERQGDRADTGMPDYARRRRHALLVKRFRQVAVECHMPRLVLPIADLRNDVVLDQPAFDQFIDRSDQPVERRRGADGEKDTKTSPAYSTPRTASATSAHCTRHRSATLRISLPLAESPSHCATLSIH